jgi:hypothetical protein
VGERERYAFELFPRGDLSVAIDRREALLRVFTEVKVHDGQSRGGNAHRLSALGSLGDEVLGLLSPTLQPGCRIEEGEGLVWAQLSGARRPMVLFPADSPARSVFERFDGLTMIEALARTLAAEQEWTEAKAFAYVRGLFLHLMTLGVCVPK